MTTQNSPQSQKQLQHQLNMLREYSKTLELENQSRNEERIRLEGQIERLLALEKNWQGGDCHSDATCGNCERYKAELFKLNNQLQRLDKDNTNLQNSNSFLSQQLSKLNQTTQPTSRIITIRSTSQAQSPTQSNSIGNSNITLGPTGIVQSAQVSALQSKLKQKEQSQKNLQIELTELKRKFQFLGSENQSNKKNIESLKGFKDKYQKLEETMNFLQLQKQNISIKLSTTQLQLHNTKKTLSQKQNQIFGYKTKLASSGNTTTSHSSSLTILSPSQNELKTLKQSLIQKQSMIQRLNSKIQTQQKQLQQCTKHFQQDQQSLQSELRMAKSTLQTKQSQLANLKEIIKKSEGDSSKNYRLEADLRAHKYQITTLETQLQGLRNRVRELEQEGETKVKGYQTEIKAVRDMLDQRDNRILQLVQQVQQIPHLLQQLANTDIQLKTLKSRQQQQQKLSKLQKSVQPVTPTQCSHQPQIAQLNQQLQTQQKEVNYLTQQLGRKKQELLQKEIYIQQVEEEIRLLVKRNQEQNFQLGKFDKIVSSYIEKIGELEIQINQLEKGSLNVSLSAKSYAHNMSNTSNILQLQQPSNTHPQAQPQLSPIPSIFQNNQIIILTEQNRLLHQKLKQFQSHVDTLQKSIHKYERQLEVTKNKSAGNSRVIVQEKLVPVVPDEELIETIKLLKMEVDDIRLRNKQLTNQNQYLQAKLSSAQIQIKKLVHTSKVSAGSAVMSATIKSNQSNSGIRNNMQPHISNFPAGMSMPISAQSPSTPTHRTTLPIKFANSYSNQAHVQGFAKPVNTHNQDIGHNNASVSVSVTPPPSAMTNPTQPKNVISFSQSARGSNTQLIKQNTAEQSPKITQPQTLPPIRQTQQFQQFQQIPQIKKMQQPVQNVYISSQLRSVQEKNLNIITTNNILSAVPMTQINKRFITSAVAPGFQIDSNAHVTANNNTINANTSNISNNPHSDRDNNLLSSSLTGNNTKVIFSPPVSTVVPTAVPIMVSASTPSAIQLPQISSTSQARPRIPQIIVRPPQALSTYPSPPTFQKIAPSPNQNPTANLNTSSSAAQSKAQRIQIYANTSISMLDDTERDPFTSQIIENNNKKIKAIQQEIQRYQIVNKNVNANRNSKKADFDVVDVDAEYNFEKEFNRQKQMGFNLQQFEYIPIDSRVQKIYKPSQPKRAQPSRYPQQPINNRSNIYMSMQPYKQTTITNSNSSISFNPQGRVIQTQVQHEKVERVVVPPMQVAVPAPVAVQAGSQVYGKKSDYSDLQRKIQMLKKENKGLRRHLYDE